MADYIRLPEPPMWCISYPTCSACCIDLETDGDGWLCPSCGTSWGMDASDGDEGFLYAEWAGEESTGPEVSTDDAYHWGDYLERLERHKLWPNLVPEPKRPEVAEALRGGA